MIRLETILESLEYAEDFVAFFESMKNPPSDVFFDFRWRVKEKKKGIFWKIATWIIPALLKSGFTSVWKRDKYNAREGEIWVRDLDATSFCLRIPWYGTRILQQIACELWEYIFARITHDRLCLAQGPCNAFQKYSNLL